MPFSSPGDLPDPRIEPRSPTFQADALTSELPGKPKKIRDTKGTFHAKMGSIKDRKGLDLTEVEDIKKRWQEYTEELYKKYLHD